MKYYPTEIEFIDDDKDLIARAKLFEDNSWEVMIGDGEHGKLISPEELRYIADVLEKQKGATDDKENG